MVMPSSVRVSNLKNAACEQHNVEVSRLSLDHVVVPFNISVRWHEFGEPKVVENVIQAISAAYGGIGNGLR